MAITTAFTITVGNLGASYDITSEVMSFNVNTQVSLAEIGTSKGSMLIKNFTGSFTPGGGGTYGNVDWFNQAVLINGTTTVGGVPTSFKLFHGIVDQFALDDNGVNSYVTISFIDALTAGGRSATVATGGVAGTASSTIETFYENLSPSNPAQMPTLGGTSAGYTVTTKLLTSDYSVQCTSPNVGNSLNSSIQLLITSVGPSMVIPTKITLTNPDFGYELIDYTMTRNAANRTTFLFKDKTVSGTQLPIGELVTGYDEDQLTNYVTTTQVDTGNTITSFNPTSTTKYGQRFRSYTQVAFVAFDVFTQQRTNDSWINRFGEITFAPQELSFSSKMVQSAAADAAEPFWNKILDIESVMWQPVQLTYTPTGCAQQTKMSVIQSRRISATPSDCQVTLGLLPAYQYQSFILDDTYLGILDSSRIA
ncbi:hypothetical protein UFOVP364_10 [uncultured Caudovirales phage]|uniref:Uncharacterized protein n=1 Tax=uncultured Caudovirales phage TaxID=2100421 RepID=A0A6J7WVK0_9CAUD|nr:hypothetical protein UFOVP364_10 [uncultured Caudovirales phage]